MYLRFSENTLAFIRGASVIRTWRKSAMKFSTNIATLLIVAVIAYTAQARDVRYHHIKHNSLQNTILESTKATRLILIAAPPTRNLFRSRPQFTYCTTWCTTLSLCQSQRNDHIPMYWRQTHRSRRRDTTDISRRMDRPLFHKQRRLPAA